MKARKYLNHEKKIQAIHGSLKVRLLYLRMVLHKYGSTEKIVIHEH